MRRITYLFKVFFSSRQETILRRVLIENKRRKEMELIKCNTKFKNIHQGKRCFIIGNGPSIKQIDLSQLKDEITFTVNQLPRMNEFSEIRTTYHLWSDERFFDLDPQSEEDAELLRVMKSVNTKGNKPTVFYKTTAHSMIDEFNLTNDLDIEYYMDGGIGNQQSTIEYPIDRLIPKFATCIHYAIVIAVYMGFSEIYLLGCDCTGIINTINARIDANQAYEYAYQVTENEKKRMMKVSKYTSIADEFEWYGNLLRTYGVLYEYAQNHKCSLYNATETSIIEGVPKVDFERII